MAKPISELRKIRLQKLEKIKKLGIDPYPARCIRKQTIAQALKMMGKNVAVAGRIMAIREHGGIQFFDLRDESGKIQLVFKKENLTSKNYRLISLLDIGDFIDVQGKVFKTDAGEISVLVKDFHLLTKSLRPLPSKWYGLKDIELRHRKRYLDLLLNKKVKDTFIRRGQVLNAIRNFLDEKEFVEVETPILQSVAGGAIARPFKTHLEALDKDFFLRIAPELHLKRMLVGGFEKVYEMGEAFRNEGFSRKHNPEYTLLEIYQAYADYNDIMDLAQELVMGVAKQVLGKTEFEFRRKKISLKGKWPRIKMRTLIKEKTGVDIDEAGREDLVKIFKREKIKIEPGADRGKLIDKFFEAKVEPELIQPTFVIDLPKDVSPLAKAHPKEKDYVERFELYIGGFEIANAYSEINNPLEQKERFLEQIEKKKKGEEETHPMDKDFIEALEYGMPPAGGIGFGVDRLVILFTDMPNIREVILFPTLRPERKKHGKKG